MHQDSVEVSLEPVGEGCTRLIKHADPHSTPDWRPRQLRVSFFIGAAMVTSVHSAMCVALLVLHYTKSTLFTFSASNGSAFWFWQFVPITVAVIPGMVWEVVYIAVCRTQPYRDLARPHGSTLVDSLSQTYVTSFSWFVPYHAMKHPNKHTAVALISVTYLLSFGVLPTVTTVMLKVEWNDAFSPTEGTAQVLVYFLIPALVASLSTLAFAISTFLVLRCQKSGVYGDPASIAGLGALVAESNILEKFRLLRSFESQAGIDKALGEYRVCLEQTGGPRKSCQIALLDPSQHVSEAPYDGKWTRDSSEAHPWWLRRRTYLGLHFLMIIPYVVIYSTVQQDSYNAVLNSEPLQINMNSFVLRICTTMIALVVSAIYANWHANVALLQPFHDLARPKIPETSILGGSKNALQVDFTASSLYNLSRKRQSVEVWFLAVLALLTHLSVILQPANTQNITFIVVLGMKDNQALSYGTEAYSVPGGIPVLRVISYVWYGILLSFALIAFAIVMFNNRKPFLPRKPFTLSSIILYLCNGNVLPEDLQGMSTLSKKARDHRLDQKGIRYGLGWMEDEDMVHSRVGINRLDRISMIFKYPKADLNVPEDTYDIREPERVDGGPVAGGPVAGGPIDGEPIDGGPVDGGRVDGGQKIRRVENWPEYPR